MTVPILSFFNNKGGVGKTSLVYHLAWTLSDMGKKVVVFDLDPQANLTAWFLDEENIEKAWNSNAPGATIHRCIEPLANVGDIVEPSLVEIDANLYLLPGDVRLSGFEETLSQEWPNSMGANNLYRPMRILSSFWQLMQMAVQNEGADIILVDVGPNLGAINRSAMIATDYVAIPMAADLFSLQGIKNLGPTLETWQKDWQTRLTNWYGSQESAKHNDFILPKADIEAIGYLCHQHGIRLNRPVMAYDKWRRLIPEAYARHVLRQEQSGATGEDIHCLAEIKHYRSLVPMAQEHRKPIFRLTVADGAIGSHANAARDAREDFRQLASKIAGRVNMEL
ncbi:MAG: ParA family protein [Candidatus Porifericomitaceae bacterium WSBS_2022_MAG_OTU9]